MSVRRPDETVERATSTSWPLVYALAGMQLVVTLGWMAYAQFQPQLLRLFGLSAFATPLAVYIGFTGATLAPVVGSLSDRVARRSGSRLAVVIAGALLAGATFVAVASTVVAAPSGALRWMLLALIALWVAAMTVFQAPALALLPQSAPAERWPIVASPLVVATVLPAALWPVVSPWLDEAGGPMIFLLGGVAVVAAALLLRRATAEGPVIDDRKHPVRSDTSLGMQAALAFVLGGGSAFITRLASETVPWSLTAALGNGEGALSIWATATLGSSSVFAPSLSSLTIALGKRRALVGSIIVAALCAGAAPWCASLVAAIPLALTLGAALALYLDCALPCAFETVPNAFGLSGGLYLGGVFAGSQLAALAGLT